MTGGTIVDTLEASKVRPVSVIPGRQRWDVPMITRRPDLAALLVAQLRDLVGITDVTASTVTGRVLLLHDATLADDDVGPAVRRAAASVASHSRTPPAHASLEPVAASADIPARSDASGLATVVGGTAVLGIGALIGSPLVCLAGVFGSTALVVRQAWRRASVRQGRTPSTSLRRPLRQIVGDSGRRQLHKASCLSVLAQLVFLSTSVSIISMYAVLIYGPSALLARLGIGTAAGQIFFLAGATGLFLASFAGLSYLSGLAWRNVSRQVKHEWRKRVYAHVQRAEPRYLDGDRATRLAEVMSTDVNQLGGFLSGPANEMLQLLTCVAVLVPVFLITASHLTWVAFLPVPLIAWLSFSYEEKVTGEYGQSGDTGGLLNSQLVNNMEASATIKSLGAEDYEIERISRLSLTFSESTAQADTRTTAYLQTVQLFSSAAFFGVLVLGGLDVLTGWLSFAVFNFLVSLPFLLHGKIPGLGGAIEQYQRTIVSLERVQELLEIPIESDGIGLDLDVANVHGEIVVHDVTFAYPGRSPVLDHLSLRVSPGKTTGIVGVTGAGKTTVVKLLLRLQDVESGRVLLDGVDIRDLKLRDLRAAIGFVSQDPFLFDGTVGDNIRYGTFDADQEGVLVAARVAAADDFIQDLPDKYNTLVGEKGITLSGGQKQRISLARLILKGAPILILDEATSAVDNETEAAIRVALRDFAGGRTLVIIAHRLSTVRNADWIYVMGRGGAIVEEGTHDELVALDGVYASLWRLQIGEML